jgi:hypothetical protein
MKRRTCITHVANSGGEPYTSETAVDSALLREVLDMRGGYLSGQDEVPNGTLQYRSMRKELAVWTLLHSAHSYSSSLDEVWEGVVVRFNG